MNERRKSHNAELKTTVAPKLLKEQETAKIDSGGGFQLIAPQAIPASGENGWPL